MTDNLAEAFCLFIELIKLTISFTFKLIFNRSFNFYIYLFTCDIQQNIWHWNCCVFDRHHFIHVDIWYMTICNARYMDDAFSQFCFHLEFLYLKQLFPVQTSAQKCHCMQTNSSNRTYTRAPPIFNLNRICCVQHFL